MYLIYKILKFLIVIDQADRLLKRRQNKHSEDSEWKN